MTAIGKGDFVEALLDSDDDGFGGRLIKGQIYRVCEVYGPGEACELCGDDSGSIDLDGLTADPEWGWCTCYFKPISGGPSGMFNELLKAPTDAPTKEPVAA